MTTLPDEPAGQDVAGVMRKINQAWLAGRVEDLAPMLHPEIVMVFPGFAGRAQGREEFLAGFRDFCRSAKTEEFHDSDQQVDIAGDTAVVAFRYDMIYQRSGKRYRSTGRDVWIYQRQNAAWIAVWRTMLDAEEQPV